MDIGKAYPFFVAFMPSHIGEGNNNFNPKYENERTSTQICRDREDKQKALYGCPLVFAPEEEKHAIRWGAVILVACLGVFLWIVALAVIDCIIYR